MTDRLRITNALLVSALLHALILALVPLSRQFPTAVAPPVFDVDLFQPQEPAVEPPETQPLEQAAPEPPKPEELQKEPAVAVALPEQQIVSMPDAGKNKPPPETRFLSDRDVSVDQQSIRRGEDGSDDNNAQETAASPDMTASQAKSAAAESRPAQKAASEPGKTRVAALPSLDELLPDASVLVGQGYGQPAEQRDGPEAEPEIVARHRPLQQNAPRRPFARHRGIPDFIPDVREGDITLLNTKAEIFAPFVRRVARRVFQYQTILLRRELSGAHRGGRESVTLEAVMSPGGDLISIEVREHVAAQSFGTEHNLRRACLEGFFDRNPPPGAEAPDGNFHFLFRTHVTLYPGPQGRLAGGALFEAGLL